MEKNELIKNLMTKNIVSVDLNDIFSVAQEKMDRLSVHHMPVLEGNKLKGILSRMDILKCSNREAHTVSIESIMTSNVTVLSENDTVRKAVELLTTSSFNSLPIVNAEGELVGLITSKDLLGYLLDQY